MEKYQVTYSAAAKCDIELIYRYIFHNLANPTSAKTIIEQILKKVDALDLFPESSPVRHIKHDRKYRFLQVRHYIVVYSTNDSNHEVVVHRILHSRRNIIDILSD